MTPTTRRRRRTTATRGRTTTTRRMTKECGTLVSVGQMAPTFNKQLGSIATVTPLNGS